MSPSSAAHSCRVRMRDAPVDPVHAEAIEELTGIDDVGGEEERVAAGGARVEDVRRAGLARESTALRGIGVGVLVRDDLARRARRGDGGCAEIGKEGEDEDADEEGETECRAAPAHSDPLLPLATVPDADVIVTAGDRTVCTPNE